MQMDLSLVYELLGYLASILVAVSLTMRSVLRLRVINLLGAACFLAYGLLITAYPIAVVNGIIVGINLYYLREMRQSENYFSILETDQDTAYLHRFLNFYEEDISSFFPSFDYSPTEQDFAWFILRDLVPVGLFIAEPKGQNTLFVHLDYVIPGYRDLRPGEFLYEEQAERFGSRGIEYLETVPETKEQCEYVERMGFAPAGSDEGKNVYRRSV
jgi:hypothetical protein